jgi:hypothetical protein
MNIEEADRYWTKQTREMEDSSRLYEEGEDDETRNEGRQERFLLPIVRVPLQSSPEESRQVSSEDEEQILIEGMP